MENIVVYLIDIFLSEIAAIATASNFSKAKVHLQPTVLIVLQSLLYQLCSAALGFLYTTSNYGGGGDVAVGEVSRAYIAGNCSA